MSSRRIIMPHVVTPGVRTGPVQIRERRAPQANPRATIQGWLDWRLVDRAGTERDGGQQSNLWLDQGLERMPFSSGSYGPFDTKKTWNSNPEDFFSHFAVGTGSTEPTVLDTALVSELARTGQLQDYAYTEVSAGVYDLMIEREFDFAEANGNLTEWGVADGAVGNLLVRELFRDELGDPVTVTKTSDYKLRLKYTCRVSLEPVTDTVASFDITGIGTINGVYRFHVGSSSFQDLCAFSNLMRGHTSTSGYGYNTGFNASSSALPPRGTDMIVFAMPTNDIDIEAYVSGSQQRKITECRWGTSSKNFTWATLAWSRDRIPGFGFLIDLADRFTKDDEHIITLTDPMRVSWDRAGGS